MGRFHDFRCQLNRTDLRQHGGYFELPLRFQMACMRYVFHVAPDSQGATEGRRIGDAKNIRKHLDAAHQGVFQQFFFCLHKPILDQARRDDFLEQVYLAGLGQKAKDRSFVDCDDGGIEIRVPVSITRTVLGEIL